VLDGFAVILFWVCHVLDVAVARVMLRNPFFDEVCPVWCAVFKSVVILFLGQSCGEVAWMEEPGASQVRVD